MSQTWEEFRKEDEIRRSERYIIKSDLLEWAEEYKRTIVKNEPADDISKGEFIILNKLIDKLNNYII